MKYLSLAALLFVVLLSGCRSGDKEITVEFQLVQNGTPYTMSAPFSKGDTAIALDLFHYYISELTIGDALVSDVLFVDPSDSNYSNYTFNLDKRATSLSFGLGVPEDMNAMDPTTFATSHPLSSAFAMYWTWASKYRFIKAEGRFNASGDLSDAANNEGIIWHTGTDPLYRTKTIEIDVRPGDHLVFKLDLDQLITGLSLAQNGFTHTTVDTFNTAEKVSNEAIASIEVVVE
jgi:hypothetical protein